jgi:hypothetical protein
MKTCVSVLNALFRGTKVAKHPFYSIRPEMIYRNVTEHFANLLHVKRCKTCVLGLNALFGGTKVAKVLSQQKRPFYSIRPKMMFVSVSEHFNNLLHVKGCKTCVSGLNALFRGTKVAKHPFYSIGPKMIYRNVTEHFANLLHVKRCKTCVTGLNALFWGVPKLRRCFRNKSIHSTPLDPK